MIIKIKMITLLTWRMIINTWIIICIRMTGMRKNDKKNNKKNRRVKKKKE